MPQQDWHFYSTDPNEKNTIGIRDGHWIGNQSFWAPPKDTPGVVPVYRCFNKAWLNHFWSTRQDELAGKAGFVDEGIVFYVFSAQQLGTVPLKRFVCRLALQPISITSTLQLRQKTQRDGAQKV